MNSAERKAKLQEVWTWLVEHKKIVLPIAALLSGILIGFALGS